MVNPAFRRRAPYITKVGKGSSRPQEPFESSSKGPYKPQGVKHCSIDGARMVYVPTMRCFYCNACGNIMEPDPEEMQKAIEHENQSNAPIFSTADGSRIFNSSSSGHYDNMFGRRGRSSPGGITIPIKGRNHDGDNEIVEKLRVKDGRSKEMDMTFRAQDRQMESMGRTILEDKVELRRSSNITSSDELQAEKKSGSVGEDLSGVGKYNPATGRRTRLSF